MSDHVWHEHPDAAEMATGLADCLAEAIERGVAERGQACLALAGGSTPVAAYELLDQRSLPWDRVTLLPTDERWVGPNDALNNARMLREQLSHAGASGCRIIQLADTSRPPEQALDGLETLLNGLPRPFDLVLLGMGTDGHTASLFPDDPEIESNLASKRPAVPAHPPSQPTARVSLTPLRLSETRKAVLAISGRSKRDVLTRALSCDPDDAPPIARTAARLKSPIHIHWCP